MSDEYAAPSDIMWRIEEIKCMMDARDPADPYVCPIADRQWLDRNIENLILVERGGL